MTGRIGLVTDSSAQLPEALAGRAAIEIVPVTVVLDGAADDETRIDVDGFYRRIADGAAVSTATPGPGVFAEVYDRLAAAGAREVISLHVDGRLSGVVRSARIAAEATPVPVHVVDTRQVSFGVALCALQARRALEDRAGPVAAIAHALRLSSRLRNASFVAVPAATGRIDVRSALVAVVDGGTSVIETGVDAATAPARLARHVLDGPSSLGVAIGHAGREARPGADALARLLEDAPAVRTVSRYRVGPSVGAHTGPGAFGCFWWPAAGASPETYLD